jgi:hypothetical protein
VRRPAAALGPAGADHRLRAWVRADAARDRSRRDPQVFDHHRIVRRLSGQLAILSDPYNAPPRGELAAFADRHGMVLDHYGDGLWRPRSTVSFVLRVVAAELALPHFGTYGSRSGSGKLFQVSQPKRFMPPGTDMAALRRRRSSGPEGDAA